MTFSAYGLATIALAQLEPEVEGMARRRGVQRPKPYKRGGKWLLRWWEDRINDEGKLVRAKSPETLIGLTEGPGKITKREAERIADEHMAKVNREQILGPTASTITLDKFVERIFIPRWVERKRTNHYRDTLPHVQAALGEMPLREIKPRHVERLLESMAGRNYSKNYIRHVRNTVHIIFEQAAFYEFYNGRNPATGVPIPEDARAPKQTQPYTLDELKSILAHLDEPLWTMFALGACAAMDAATLAGLTVECVNLTDKPVRVQDRDIPPGALFTAQSYSNGKYSSGKTANRRRVLPIPGFLRNRLAKMIEGRPGAEPVFVMPRTWAVHKRALPIDTGNVTHRRFKTLSKKLGVKVNWHRLRATNATFTYQMGADPNDRVALMGHWSESMTAAYTDPFGRLREIGEAIGSKLFEGGAGRVM
ncbi:MAG: site-specific integrase [Rhodospirillaceae bacterium]